MFINNNFYLICYFIIYFILYDEISGNEQPTDFYHPSPYNLEDYCTSDNSYDFAIDEWKAAIFRYGFKPSKNTRQKIHRCKINIKTKKAFRLVAAFEHMKIRGRRNLSNKWQCKDYVQFSVSKKNVIENILNYFDVSIFHYKSEELCGNKQLDDAHFDNIFDRSTDANSFVSSFNELTMEFHQDENDHENENINNTFIIVVTTFKQPNEQVFAAGCKGKHMCTRRYCIGNDLVCDGHVNCAFPGSATDEKHCRKTDRQPSKTLIILVTLASMVALGVVVCLVATALCRVHASLTNINRPRSRGTSPTEFTNLELDRISPTAPNEHPLPAYETVIEGQKEVSNQEMPPQYDALFPEGPPKEVHRTPSQNT